MDVTDFLVHRFPVIVFLFALMARMLRLVRGIRAWPMDAWLTAAFKNEPTEEEIQSFKAGRSMCAEAFFTCLLLYCISDEWILKPIISMLPRLSFLFRWLSCISALICGVGYVLLDLILTSKGRK